MTTVVVDGLTVNFAPVVKVPVVVGFAVQTGVATNALAKVTVTVPLESATDPNAHPPAGALVVFAVEPCPPRCPEIPTLFAPFFCTETSVEVLSPNHRLNEDGK